MLVCAASAYYPIAAQVLYSNDFSDAASLAKDFTVLDFPSTLSGPSDWNIAKGVLNQASNINGPTTAGTGIPFEKGTFLLYREPLSGNWDMQVKFKASDNDGLGLVFDYSDNTHFHWLEWDAQDSILAFCQSEKQADSGTIVSALTGENHFKNTGYVKPTAWEHAQGLASDGTNYYLAGHNDPVNLEADIHVIRKSDHKEIAKYANVGPLHSAELDMYETHGSLLACSGGNGRLPYVWELNSGTGAKVNAWDYAGIGENGGALLSWVGEDDILLFTSSADGAKIAFTRTTLGKSGAKTIGKTWKYSATNLGVPQGMDYVDGYIYYLADAGPTVSQSPHYLYKISLDSAGVGINIVEKYLIPIGVETEGLDISADYAVSFATAEEKINRFDESLQLLNPDPGGYLPETWYTLRLEKTANNYRVSIDGKLRMSLKDSTFSSGKVGLMSRGSTGLQFDDFKISTPVLTAIANRKGRQMAMPGSEGRGRIKSFNLAGQRVPAQRFFYQSTLFYPEL